MPITQLLPVHVEAPIYAARPGLSTDESGQMFQVSPVIALLMAVIISSFAGFNFPLALLSGAVGSWFR